MSRSLRPVVAVLVVAAVLAGTLDLRPAESQTATRTTPKMGGSLNLMLREDLPPASRSMRRSTISTVWPARPCFNNLVLFDPLKPTESVDTIIGELAERWSWQDNYRNLVFFLRKDVKWHDGKPFTSKDVKSTFDMVRETTDAPAKLRLNPRKEWYVNVDAVEAPDAHTVVFRLKRPQPSLLLMLASGYSPIYAAHVPAASYRTGCIGTGPFKLKDWRKGEFVEYVKNADYFVKGRPYLDGLQYLIIEERGTPTAALQAGQLDVAFPGETPKAIAEQLKRRVPQIMFDRSAPTSPTHRRQHEEAAVRQPEGPAAPSPTPSTAAGHHGGLPGRRELRRRMAPGPTGSGAWPRQICSGCPATASPPRKRPRHGELAEAGSVRRCSEGRASHPGLAVSPTWAPFLWASSSRWESRRR